MKNLLATPKKTSPLFTAFRRFSPPKPGFVPRRPPRLFFGSTPRHNARPGPCSARWWRRFPRSFHHGKPVFFQNVFVFFHTGLSFRQLQEDIASVLELEILALHSWSQRFAHFLPHLFEIYTNSNERIFVQTYPIGALGFNPYSNYFDPRLATRFYRTCSCFRVPVWLEAHGRTPCVRTDTSSAGGTKAQEILLQGQSGHYRRPSKMSVLLGKRNEVQKKKQLLVIFDHQCLGLKKNQAISLAWLNHIPLLSGLLNFGLAEDSSQPFLTKETVGWGQKNASPFVLVYMSLWHAPKHPHRQLPLPALFTSTDDLGFFKESTNINEPSLWSFNVPWQAGNSVTSRRVLPATWKQWEIKSTAVKTSISKPSCTVVGHLICHHLAKQPRCPFMIICVSSRSRWTILPFAKVEHTDWG